LRGSVARPLAALRRTCDIGLMLSSAKKEIPTERTESRVTADAEHGSWVERAPRAWQPYLRLARLDRPIGSWLLFWPCVAGLALGALADDRTLGEPHDVLLIALFAIGSIAMRGAGCTYNDIVDRDLDAKVARTRNRPLPSGAVNLRDAWLFLLAQCLVGLAVLALLNLLAVETAACSLLLVAAYPFMKRITWWPQAWLGFTFNWGALVGFAAVTGRFDWGILFLYAGLVFWTLGYDTIYALQDRDDDSLIGIKSTARLFGDRSADWILGFYGVSVTFILAAGLTEHAGWPFVLLILVAGGHLLWQVRQLNARNSENCLKLFRANRETGAMLAFAFVLASWAT